MEFFFGTLRARAVGGVHTVSSNLTRSKFENALKPYGSWLGEVWRSMRYSVSNFLCFGER